MTPAIPQVEIITVDQGYQPMLEGDAGYKPKVATWGVFPRPQDISKAFGGGRTIRPGEVRLLGTGQLVCVHARVFGCVVGEWGGVGWGLSEGHGHGEGSAKVF